MTNTTTSGVWSFRKWLYLPVSSVLLLASLFKFYMLIVLPSHSSLVFDSVVFTGALAVVEGGAGSLLLFSPRSDCIRQLVGALFFVFIQYSLFKFLVGETDCGCFGVVSLSPRVMLVLDVACFLAVCGMVRTEPDVEPKNLSHLLNGWGVILTLVFVMTAFWIGIAFRPISAQNLDANTGGHSLVILSPKKWLGNRFPIGEFITNFDQEVEKVTNVVFHQKDCSKCQTLLDNFNDFDATRIKTIFVEIPPYESLERKNRNNFAWLKLSDQYKWFAETPAVIRIDRDFVVKIFAQTEIDKHEFLR